MSWRSILISKSGKLSLCNRQLRIQQEGNDVTIPIEDIAVIVIENREVVVTAALLSALAKEGTTVLTCDEQFLPCGQWLPFCQYHRQLKILQLQLSMSLPLKKRLWQVIVQQKIINQSRVMVYVEQLDASNKLMSMVAQVKSGDKVNVEARAAAYYFKSLFGKSFKRWSDNDISTCLNYGYTILRSAVARSLVQYGWHPSMGLFHHSELNPFNLADDFLEVFRPLVDLMVWDLVQEGVTKNSLTPEIKKRLILLLHYQIELNNQVMSVLTAIDKVVSSFQRVVVEKEVRLLSLPDVVVLREFSYE